MTQLPLALGFGVSRKSEVDFLKGKVEVAVLIAMEGWRKCPPLVCVFGYGKYA